MARLLLVMFFVAAGTALAEAQEIRTSRDARLEISCRFYALDATMKKLESLLAEPLLSKLKAREEQIKGLRETLLTLKISYVAAKDKIKRIETDTDKSGPMWALKEIPDLENVVNRAKKQVLAEQLSPEQREIVQQDWDHMDAEKNKAADSKTSPSPN